METLRPELLKEISDLNLEQLKDLYEIIADKINLQVRKRNLNASGQFNVGDKVKFVGKGIPYEGIVVKVNPTTLKVKTTYINGLDLAPSQQDIWTVSSRLVKKA
jgi:hypothetical protein